MELKVFSQWATLFPFAPDRLWQLFCETLLCMAASRGDVQLMLRSNRSNWSWMLECDGRTVHPVTSQVLPSLCLLWLQPLLHWSKKNDCYCAHPSIHLRHLRNSSLRSPKHNLFMVFSRHSPVFLPHDVPSMSYIFMTWQKYTLTTDFFFFLYFFERFIFLKFCHWQMVKMIVTVFIYLVITYLPVSYYDSHFLGWLLWSSSLIIHILAYSPRKRPYLNITVPKNHYVNMELQVVVISCDKAQKLM